MNDGPPYASRGWRPFSCGFMVACTPCTIRYTSNHGARPAAKTLRRIRAVAAPDHRIDSRDRGRDADVCVTAQTCAAARCNRIPGDAELVLQSRPPKNTRD